MNDPHSRGPGASEPEFADYLDVVRRRKWLIALVVVLCGAAAWYLASREVPVYSASAEVLVRPVNVDPSRTTIRPDQLVNMATEQRVMSSALVAQRALDSLDIDDLTVRQLQGRTSVRTPLDTQTLIVTVVALEPERAALLAGGVAQAYLDTRRDGVQADIDRRIGDLLTQREAAEAELIEANARIAESAADSSAAATAQARADLVLSLIRDLQLQIGQTVALAVDPGEIIGPAEVPQNPVSQSFAMTMAVGIAAGLVLGLGLAFVRDRLDERVRDSEVIERRTGLGVLGVIPRESGADHSRPIVLHRPNSLTTDAFRRLRSSILTVAGERQLSSFVVTSAMPTEGKSVTAVNLSIALAQSGYKVLLVCSDLRRSTIHEVLDLPNGRGFAQVLDGSREWSDVTQQVPGVPGLEVITSGTASTRSLHLMIQGPTVERLLADQVARKVLVVMDAPPVLAVSDALEFSGLVGGVVMVVRGGVTLTSHLTDALSQLRAAGANVLGAVLAQVRPEHPDAFEYYHPDAHDRQSNRLTPRGRGIDTAAGDAEGDSDRDAFASEDPARGAEQPAEQARLS